MRTDRPTRQEQTALYVGLFLVSLFLNSMPPLILSFQSTFHISMTQSAAIPLFHSLGTIGANVLAILLLGRLGTARLSRGALLSAGIGLLLIVTSRSLLQLEIGICFVSLAFGLTITSFSTVMGHYPARFQKFSLFHGCFGAGGLVAPLVVRYALGADWTYREIYGLNLLLLIGYVVLFRPHRRIPDIREKQPGFGNFRPVLRPVVLTLLILMSLYAVSEMSVVIWSGNFFQRTQGMTAETSALLLSLFWLGYTVSRLTGDLWIHRFTLARSAWLATTCCLSALVVFLVAPGKLAVAGFLLSAMAMGTIFPALHLLLNRTLHPDARAPLNGLLFLLVSGAGFVGIPLVGVVADHALLPGMAMTLVPFALLAALLPRLARRLAIST